jgi:hypothetical protein
VRARDCEPQEDDVARRICNEHMAQNQITEGVNKPSDNRHRHEERGKRTEGATRPGTEVSRTSVKKCSCRDAPFLSVSAQWKATPINRPSPKVSPAAMSPEDELSHAREDGAASRQEGDQRPNDE